MLDVIFQVINLSSPGLDTWDGIIIHVVKLPVGNVNVKKFQNF